MNSRRSKLALVAAGIGGPAVAGFGFAFGRDIYKKTKKNVELIALLLAAVICPFIGGRGLVRGHDRGIFGTIFLTVLASLLLIAAGLCAATLLMLGVLMLVADGKLDSPFLIALLGAFVLTALLAGMGIVVGLVQRPKRLKAIAVGKFNERFLEENGFRETDGDDITHYDDSGQALRFLEAHQNRLIFMAVSRRGKRAFIDLDQDGRMIGYSGVK
ncbi:MULTISPECIES: hypothetical protein [unclassified Mesorhizobium]|uniref:hypothetical protein n=1 Tax=unclassified Mesorhizobium TaxID=325217 RepID=UPI000FCBC3C9|nr:MULTISPECIES: hypothetical protein [unclassified Mesorhizobium]RUZ91225.1 hypothetical protein EN947_04320 [Mesorhizobium sp. M7A.F.Ca.US.003.02.2.1]RUY95819.1 hypothetical protein EN974_20760 [Mesorhizobium sp. M7A.F.Ca.CA.001.12.2.1]RUZ19894.1 hypothetical protein EN949_24480 [Mesorhizobium sp. M7A.F.Ca.US.007.01.2.1]RUZ49890.1 hypothetical protein EN948_03085 [Mesorhizobium sp. M7A.F.Ca.US.003.02.1.1]RUZ70303.1 hypothetical protein EN950_00985 [Mesorhizobium sp. M7A.F.Ca.US.007.01.1.1]